MIDFAYESDIIPRMGTSDLNTKQLLDDHGVTVLQVAYIAQVHTQTVYKYLNRKRISPRINFRISKAIDSLIGKVPIQSKAAG